MIPDTFKLIGSSSGVGNAARRSLSVVVVCVVGCGVCRGVGCMPWDTRTSTDLELFFLMINVS